MTRWTAKDIPSQAGRSAIVTGTGGLGYETALALVRAGGEVIVAGRNPEKGAKAVAQIRKCANGSVQFEKVDLANLRSIESFCARLRDRNQRLDVLINNAGVMDPPERRVTDDGFELQFGSNYLGHFALTAGLMPLLRAGKDARVVTVSSIAARMGRIDFDDLQAERDYKPRPVYAQSKLACLMFAFELQRRSEASGWGVSSFAAHPGLSRTNLLHNAPGRGSATSTMRSMLWFLFQPASRGALPTLYAACAPDADPGGYYGPDGVAELNGYPMRAKPPPRSLDVSGAQRLWEVSVKLTGARF